MLAPNPVASEHDRAFWDAARAGRLLLQRCKATGTFQHYPRGHSLATGGTELEWVESPGTGTLHTFTVVRRSFFENLAAPYVLAIVQLDEGVRVTAHVVDADPDAVRIGMRGRAVFRPSGDSLPLLCFIPA